MKFAFAAIALFIATSFAHAAPKESCSLDSMGMNQNNCLLVGLKADNEFKKPSYLLVNLSSGGTALKGEQVILGFLISEEEDKNYRIPQSVSLKFKGIDGEVPIQKSLLSFGLLPTKILRSIEAIFDDIEYVIVEENETRSKYSLDRTSRQHLRAFFKKHF